MAGGDRVGLVLAGGGARGAYEAGALSVLLPELERRGERPNVIVGTSVGAINAAFLASTAHLPAEEAMALARERWLGVEWDDVLEPVLGPGTALSGARYAGAVLGVPGVELHALLDPGPLEGTLESWVDWEAMRRNLAGDALDALAVVATSARTARSTVFVEGTDPSEIESSHEIDYLAAEIGAPHVRASAAIPVAFPGVHVDRPEQAAGWYFDGGTRLNTPIKPTVDLGVDRVVVIATHSVDPRHASDWHDGRGTPDFGAAAVQLLFAALVDSLVADVRTLGKINLLIGEGGPSAEAREYRRRRGQEPHRQIPYMLISPPTRDRVGDLAAEVYGERFSGPRGALRSLDIAALGRLLGGVDEPHGELLSYLMFCREFSQALIEQGENDAREWLERDRGGEWPWLLEPIDVLD